MRAKICSLTIWKADINTGIYVMCSVSRVKQVIINTNSDDLLSYRE